MREAESLSPLLRQEHRNLSAVKAGIVALAFAMLSACAGGEPTQQVEAELDRPQDAPQVEDRVESESQAVGPESDAAEAEPDVEAATGEPVQGEATDGAIEPALQAENGAAETEDASAQADAGAAVESDAEVVESAEATPQGGTESAGLWGTSWRLTDLGGRPAMGQVQATLDFPDEGGRAVGNASCNRFFGQVQVNEDAISFIDVGTMRMACRPAVLDQETRFLAALESAERFEVEEDELRIFAGDREQPMTFVRVSEEGS